MGGVAHRRKLLSIRPRKRLQGFQPIRRVGKGSYGEVIAVKNDWGDQFAVTRLLRGAEAIHASLFQHMCPCEQSLQQR